MNQETKVAEDQEAKAKAEKINQLVEKAEKQEAKSAEKERADSTGFKRAYELEDQRLKDAQKGAPEQDSITDNEAVKTDGTANVNADKSTPTTEAQKGLPEEVRTGEVENPALEKTVEERLGLANPDDRLAEELRRAKVEGNTGAVAVDSTEAFAKKQSEDVDTRTDDITFPEGAQKAQDRKDAKNQFDLAIENARAAFAEAERALGKLERLRPRD